VNILPLILALVLMVSLLTVERLEIFKNHSVVQREYQLFLKNIERTVFNEREKRLYGEGQKSFKQITFRYFFDKKAREKHPNEAKQYRLLAIELMKNLYGQAAFFKELEQKRPSFLDEILSSIEQASDDSPKKLIKQTKDLARLKLSDPQLQEAFYRMLKGTASREEIKQMAKPTRRMKEKSYPSLLTYIHNHGKDNPPTIRVALAPPEVLKVVFPNDDVVKAIVEKRKELGGKDRDSGADDLFKSEFVEKRRPGIDENLLNFKLSDQSADYD